MDLAGQHPNAMCKPTGWLPQVGGNGEAATLQHQTITQKLSITLTSNMNNTNSGELKQTQAD